MAKILLDRQAPKLRLNYSKPTNFGVFSPGNKLPKFQNSLHLSSGSYT